MSFPRYPKYKDSGVEWLGEVPAHWTRTNLKRVVQPDRPITYGIVQAGPHDPDGVPYVRPADMSDESGVRSPEEVLRTTPAIAEAYTRSTLRTGDLVCSIGPSFGKVMVTPAWLDGANLTQGTARVAVAAPNSSRFVFWALRSGSAVAQWESSIGGATFRALNLGPLAETVLVLPPPSEQTAIAAFVDRETAKIDALVAEQKRLVELLNEKRQAIISHAVTKGLNPDAPMKSSGMEWLGQVPVHWEVKRLKHLVSPLGGIQMGPFGGMLLDLKSEATGYKVYGQENTISGDFGLGRRWIDEARFHELSSYHVQDGDILLTRKGSLGNARLIQNLPAPGIIDSDTIRVRVNAKLILDQFMSLLLHEAGYIAQEIGLTKRGAILAGLNSETIANLMIVVPSLHEQSEVLKNLEARSASIDAQIRACMCAIELLQERRAALIFAAVTGQIDVRNIADRAAA